MRRARIQFLVALLASLLGAANLASGDTDRDGCVPEDERERIEAMLAANIGQLRADRGIAAPEGTSVLLQWPLRAAVGFDDPGFHAIPAFVDHDLSPSGLDYHCGDRTSSPASNNNHRGTDISAWPHPWLKMENDQVEVVAAAAGTIVGKQDGQFDKSCGGCVGSGNQVYVRHADGSVAWYLHMKKFSVTTKSVGQTVAAGEYLGVVGSSGCSSGPHLHFELHLANGNLQDPFGGPCNSLNANSWWIEQPPYYDSALNKFTVGFLFPTAPECPGIENTNEWTTFSPVQTVYFTSYFRDPQVGQVASYRLLRPDGSLDATWSYALPHNETNVKSDARAFSLTDPPGLWRLEVDYLSQQESIEFTLTEAPGAGTAELSVSKESNGVGLTWSSSCPFQTGSGGVALGTLGSWYDHDMFFCFYTGFSGLIPWFDLQGSHYFLVVPQNLYTEGSYGQDSAGNERPIIGPGCLLQQVGCN